jgi:4-phytase / acid phosphatase
MVMVVWWSISAVGRFVVPRSLCVCLLLALLVSPGLGCAHATAIAAGPWVLERAVLLQRHGVRAPTSAPAALARYSAQAWPPWPVGPGELTEGGRRALAAMGSYLRERYAGLGLLPVSGCPAPGRLYVWADSTDERTRASGTIMAAALAPGCSLAARYALVKRDPLFHPVEGGICPLDARAAQAQIMRRVDGNLNALGTQYEQARRALEAVLWPANQGCAGSTASCPVMRGRNRLKLSRGKLKLSGPLKVGASLAENLLLEYAAGLPVDEVGWGRAASPERLQEILPLHVRYAELMRRTPEMASSGGTPLAHLMLLFLEKRPIAGAFADAPPIPASSRLVVLAGHDTNLANVGSILGLNWTLAGEPDSTAPDTTLALELWRNAHDGHQYVRAVVFYQTLDGLRAAAMGGPADSPGRAARALAIAFPGCTPSGCPLRAVRRRIERQMSRRCAP